MSTEKLAPNAIEGCTCTHRFGFPCQNGVGHDPKCALYPILHEKIFGKPKPKPVDTKPRPKTKFDFLEF